MSKLSASPKQQHDLKAQARLFVSVAVAANILFALVLAFIMIFGKPSQPPTDRPVESSMATPPAYEKSRTEAISRLQLPAPERW